MAACQRVKEPGTHVRSSVRLGQGASMETELSICWDEAEEEAWCVISDRTAGKRRIAAYRWRWRVESTFPDSQSRGWDGEASQGRALDRVHRLVLVLFRLLWWLARLAATGMHHGKRDRSDRADRRNKGIVRMGRRSLFERERSKRRGGNIPQCVLFRNNEQGWHVSLRF